MKRFEILFFLAEYQFFRKVMKVTKTTKVC